MQPTPPSSEWKEELRKKKLNDVRRKCKNERKKKESKKKDKIEINEKI